MAVSFQEGEWVWNKKHGVGQVALSSEEELLVEFDDGSEEVYELGPKKRPPLNQLSPQGLWLKKRNDRENTAEKIRQEPLEALLALSNDGTSVVTVQQLKEAVSPDLVPEDECENWIAEALSRAKEDPRFEVEKDKKISYQGDIVEIAGDVMVKFRKAPSLKEKQRVCREILKLEAKGIPVEEAKESAISFFTGTAANKTNKMGARLEALFFLKELEPEQYEYMKDPLYEEIEQMNVEQAADAVAPVTDSIIRKSLLEIIKEKKPDDFVGISMQVAKRFKKQQRDWVLDTLLEMEDKEPIKTIMDRTTADIPTNLQPFVWLARKTITAPDKVMEIGQDPAATVPAMFKIFSNIYVTSAFSVRPKDDRSVSREEDELMKLLKDHNKLISFLKKQPESVKVGFVTLYRDCNAIPEEIREEFVKKKVPEKFPDLEIEAAVEREVEEVILTPEAYEKYKAELEQIVDHGLEEATKAIQQAREFGDISENAELEIAQENQRRVLIRKNQLEHILDNARILE